MVKKEGCYTQNMKKEIVLGLGLAALVGIGIFLLNPSNQKDSLVIPLTNQLEQTKKILPSETLIDYQDPSGFTLSYPDNLSITKNDIEDENTYADIDLTTKGVNGSLSLKISDSKFKTIEEWLNLNKEAAIQPPKEVKLGSLTGMEVKLNDRLLLGVLDKGVFFDIEIPLVEEDFWMKVFEKVLVSFSFVSPESASSQIDTSSDAVAFEGEEVVE